MPAKQPLPRVALLQTDNYSLKWHQPRASHIRSLLVFRTAFLHALQRMETRTCAS